MNHEYEQNRADRKAATNATTSNHFVEPGQMSRSALLRRSEGAIASGLVQRKPQDQPRLGEPALAGLQLKADGTQPTEDIHSLAANGISGSASTLPFFEQIQHSFGRHDIRHVAAHIGGAATAACDGMGASAYATGSHVAFREAPDLHTAAHEAAHIVQQQAGVQLAGGVGQAGDRYEQHADAVANEVLQGKSAEALLDQYAGSPHRTTGVQHKCSACEAQKGKCSACRGDKAAGSGDSAQQDIASSTAPAQTSKPRESRAPLQTKRISFRLTEGMLAGRTGAGSAGGGAQSLGPAASDSASNPGGGGQAHRATAPVQRRLTVNPRDMVPLAPGTAGPPQPLSSAVQELLNSTCPTGGFSVDTSTGVVSAEARFCEWHPPFLPGKTEASTSPTPAGCTCLCDVVNDTHTTTIGFSPGGPGTSPGSVPGSGPGQAGAQTDATVSADPRFQGQYLINGRWVDVPFYLLLAHEVCGHALPKMQGTHVPRGPTPPGGTPPQEQHAVDAERDIAAEGGQPRRPDDYSGAARPRP